MSRDHATTAHTPIGSFHAPEVLTISPGNVVIIRGQAHAAENIDDDWWMGQILRCESERKGPRAKTLLQVANVDDGAVHWVSAETVSYVVHALDGIGDEQRFDDVFWTQAKSRFHSET